MLFNSQNAREFAARSAQGRRQAKLLRLERDAMLDRLIQEASNKNVQPAAHAETENECPDDGYVSRRIERIRKQIVLLEDLLEAQATANIIDAATLDRVASALARLSELERQLSGRPLPGSLRPTAPRRQVAQFTPPSDG